MKILYDARFITAGRTGVGRLAENLLKALVDYCPHLTVCALYVDHPGTIPSVEYIRAPVPFDSHPSGDLYRNLNLRRLLKTESFDLYFSPGFYSIQLKSPVPQVVMIHDMAVFDCPESFPHRFVKYLRLMIRSSCHRADAIITSSRFAAGRIVELFPVAESKVRVVPYGVQPGFMHRDRSRDAEIRKKWALPNAYILTIASIEPRKNLMALLDAYAVYRRRTERPLPLIIVGKEGHRAREIKKRAERHDMEFSVRLLNYIPENVLGAIYAMAEFMIYPSLYEGFGLPVLEAMASGCPVIASERSSIPEVVGDSGILIDPADPVNMSNAMIRLSEDKEDAARFRDLGYARAAVYTWEKTAAQICPICTALKRR
ncbi:glycosyltransferase family 4 protein [bacterium]|nr:glycosyltransferase family 4 protein [candidate division CSSED10-310 bacterium]